MLTIDCDNIIIINCNNNNNNGSGNGCILSELCNKSNSYYQFEWFKYILKNYDMFEISNNWKCAFLHLPFKWLFHKDSFNFNNIEMFYDIFHSIYIIYG